MSEARYDQPVVASNEVELTPLKKAQQKVLDFLKPPKVDASKMQAEYEARIFETRIKVIEDYAELQLTGNSTNFEKVNNRIIQRYDEITYYAAEMVNFSDITDDLHAEVTRGIRDPYERRIKFGQALMEIKNQAKANKSQQPQAPPEQ